jgi:hypothetical protein
MRRIHHRLALALLLVASVAHGASETLNPNADVDPSGEAETSGYTAVCSSGTACTSMDCWANIDDTTASGDGLEVAGDTCNGSSATSYTTYWDMSPPTGGAGAQWNGTQTIEVRAINADGTGGALADMEIEAWCGTTPQALTGTGCGVTALTDSEALYTCTFTSSDVGCLPDAIRIGVICTRSGGSPSGRRSCAIDAIELQGDFVTTTTTTTTTTTLGGRRRMGLMD